MAYTAHKDEESIKEHHEIEADVRAKARETADLLRNSKHAVFFTGAGISTSAGIPDYRGPEGVWTLRAKGLKTKKGVNLIRAAATATHMAIVELVNDGTAKLIISQNVDGLHRKSGVPPQNLAELHGNTSLEICKNCGKQYLRDFSVRVAVSVTDHFTQRYCAVPGCNGELHDSIINFGESLPVHTLENAYKHSQAADLHIVLGSSLTVSPANELPLETKKRGGKLVIVNLQKTHLDKYSDVRVFAPVDQFMKAVMEELNKPIPPFVLTRYCYIWKDSATVQPAAAAESTITVAAVDSDLIPASIFYSVTAQAKGHERKTCEAEPFQFKLPNGVPVDYGFQFYGNYGEPDAVVQVPAHDDCCAITLKFTPSRPQDGWQIEQRACEFPAELRSQATPSQPRQRRQPDASVSSQPGRPDMAGWHAVVPLDDCPHTVHVLANGMTVDPQQACKGCGNVGENMVCLQCHEVLCGRHVNKHMLEHYETTGHSIVCGFVDLSFWCYTCEAYINPTNRVLAPIYVALHTAKFGHPPAGMAHFDD